MQSADSLKEHGGPSVPFDHQQAAMEGWVVSECEPQADGTSGVQLQHIDFPESGKPFFPDDRDAWAHVVARARAGSLLHRQALELVDETERALIRSTWGTW